MFIDAIVKDFLHQDINAVILRCPVAQFADVHPGPEPDMFPPVEGFNAIFRIFFGDHSYENFPQM